MADLLAGFAEGMMEGMRDQENRKYRQMELDARLKSSEEQKRRQQYMDKFEMRRAGFKVPEGDIGQIDPANLEVDQDYFRAKSEADPMARAIKGLQLQGAQLDVQKKGLEAGQAAKGFKLPPDKVLSVQQGAQMPKVLADIESTLASSKDLFGPFAGRYGGANPYEDKSQTVRAQLKTAAQNIGKYLEGGVLRKEDEVKYEQMLPTLNDTPEVAKNKLALVRKMLIDKQNADVQALAAQGYDTSGFSTLPSSDLPDVLKKRSGLMPGGKMQDGMMPHDGAAGNIDAKKRRLEELRAKAAAG